MFNGIWLVACEPITERGREYQPGERFEISRTQSGALLVTGRALIAERPAPPAPEPEPARRRRGRPRKTTPPVDDAQPKDGESDPSADTAVVEPRRYQRRDLEAEE